MALNDVIYNRGEGGLGRALVSNDHISGMVFYSDTLPTGFASDDRIKKIMSLSEAENLGILDDHADETKATGGKVVIGGTWVAGEVATIDIDDGVLGTFIATTTTPAHMVTGLVAAINALTTVHGYSATDVGGTDVEITAPAKLGLSINTGVGLLTFTTDSVAGTGTETQFTSGVGSFKAVMHYHISEYFRMQPKGVVYVGIYAAADGTTYTGVAIQTVQDYAEGTIRQMSVYNQMTTLASGQITASQTYATTNETNHKPLSVILHSDMTGLSLSTLSDISTLSSKRVSVNISQEPNWNYPAYVNTKAYVIGDKITFNGKSFSARKATTGNIPYDTDYWSETSINLNAISGFTIGTLGNLLGVVSYAKVHQCIANPDRFNLTSGLLLDGGAFATGELYKDVAVAQLETLNDQHYIFTRNHIGLAGTYYNDSWTAIASTSDYATIENNRTIDKFIRSDRTLTLPLLASDIYLNEDGTLTEDTIAVYKNPSDKVIRQMTRDGEISDAEATIDPAQDVLGTSKIVKSVLIIPVGIARRIETNIGYTVKL